MGSPIFPPSTPLLQYSIHPTLQCSSTPTCPGVVKWWRVRSLSPILQCSSTPTCPGVVESPEPFPKYSNAPVLQWSPEWRRNRAESVLHIAVAHAHHGSSNPARFSTLVANDESVPKILGTLSLPLQLACSTQLFYPPAVDHFGDSRHQQGRHGCASTFNGLRFCFPLGPPRGTSASAFAPRENGGRGRPPSKGL